jgi:hypothetical protein
MRWYWTSAMEADGMLDIIRDGVPRRSVDPRRHCSLTRRG